MLDYAMHWCEIPKGKNQVHFKRYPPLSIEQWHKKHKLWIE
jgi:hypothetical protein